MHLNSNVLCFFDNYNLENYDKIKTMSPIFVSEEEASYVVIATWAN